MEHCGTGRRVGTHVGGAPARLHLVTRTVALGPGARLGPARAASYVGAELIFMRN